MCPYNVPRAIMDSWSGSYYSFRMRRLWKLWRHISMTLVTWRHRWRLYIDAPYVLSYLGPLLHTNP